MAWTKEQRRAWEREYVAKNREHVNARARAGHARHRAERNARSHQYYLDHREDEIIKGWWTRRKLREEVLTAYGRKCACCGEDEIEFLTMDHIHGGGKAHLKEIGGTSGLHVWLRRNGFPKDTFQILCFNCNLGRAKNGGICPHKAEPAE